MQNTRFRADNERLLRAIHNVFQQGRRGPHEISLTQNMLLTFGVGNELRFGVFGAEFVQFLQRYIDVNDTGTFPKHHITARFLRNETTEVGIRREDDFLVFRQTFNNFQRVGRRDNNVGQRLYFGRAVDVG